ERRSRLIQSRRRDNGWQIRQNDLRHVGVVERRIGDRIHQHDRRAARLRSQLAEDHDGGRNASDAGEPAAMIRLRRLGGSEEFDLNPDLILTVESTPDTVVTLTTGTKLVVD